LLAAIGTYICISANKFNGANAISNSQGTAVMMNSISKLPENIKKKVVGVVYFGYTKNGQQKGGIPNYPKENVLVLCSKSDGVCGGQLLVTAGHFSYMSDGSGPKAINFLTSKINGGKASISGGETSASDNENPAPLAGLGGGGKAGKFGKFGRGGKGGKDGNGRLRALEDMAS
jgi:cutinase